MRHCLALALVAIACAAQAQVPPTEAELRAYTGLHAAAAKGDAAEIARIATRANVDARDSYRRTPLHVAAHRARHEAMRALVKAGADPNALEHDRYDIVTIAAVADDVATLRVALECGHRRARVREEIGQIGPGRLGLGRVHGCPNLADQSEPSEADTVLGRACRDRETIAAAKSVSRRCCAKASRIR